MKCSPEKPKRYAILNYGFNQGKNVGVRICATVIYYTGPFERKKEFSHIIP